MAHEQVHRTSELAFRSWHQPEDGQRFYRGSLTGEAGMNLDASAWQQCADPYEMLDFLTTSPRSLTAPCQRKLQLLCCACCRRLGPQLSPEDAAGLESAERRADEWLAADFVDKPFAFQRWAAHGTTIPSIIRSAVEEACENRGTCLCFAASALALQAVPPDLSWRTQDFRAARSAELATQAALIRDLFGNPFRPSPAVTPAWLSWNHGTVCRLAQLIYSEGEFRRLPVLADALEEAGCSDADLLGHCQAPGPHARGCWPVDRILGKY